MIIAIGWTGFYQGAIIKATSSLMWREEKVVEVLGVGEQEQD